MNDLPEGYEILEVDRDDAIEDLIVDQRDLRLLDALDDVHARRAAEPIQVGVLYGAGHMRTWLTVFTIDD